MLNHAIKTGKDYSIEYRTLAPDDLVPVCDLVIGRLLLKARTTVGGSWQFGRPVHSMPLWLVHISTVSIALLVGINAVATYREMIRSSTEFQAGDLAVADQIRQSVETKMQRTSPFDRP